MEMYALSITPLIRRLRSDEPSVKQVLCTYDSQVGGKINPLRRWWQCLSTAVQQMGYYPGASKTNLIVETQFQGVATKVFKGKGIKVTTKGHEIRGSTLRNIHYTKSKTLLRKLRISPRTLSPICVCWLYPLYYDKEALYNANSKGY